MARQAWTAFRLWIDLLGRRDQRDCHHQSQNRPASSCRTQSLTAVLVGLVRLLPDAISFVQAEDAAEVSLVDELQSKRR